MEFREALDSFGQPKNMNAVPAGLASGLCQRRRSLDLELLPHLTSRPA